MKEVFKKIKERLETEKAELTTWAEDMAFKLGINKAIEIVNQVEEEYKGGWIPCIERLPSKEGYYLVTCQEGTKMVHEAFYMNPKWLVPKEEFGEIIAWQPLPEPYKGE